MSALLLNLKRNGFDLVGSCRFDEGWQKNRLCARRGFRIVDDSGAGQSRDQLSQDRQVFARHLALKEKPNRFGGLEPGRRGRRYLAIGS